MTLVSFCFLKKTVYPLFIPSDIHVYTACASYSLVGDGLRLETANCTLFIANQHFKNSPITKIFKKNILVFLLKTFYVMQCRSFEKCGNCYVSIVLYCLKHKYCFCLKSF
jgi:hypothetical protein